MRKYVLIRMTTERPQNELVCVQFKYYDEVDKQNLVIFCVPFEGLVKATKPKTKIKIPNKLVLWSFCSEWDCSRQLESEVCTVPKEIINILGHLVKKLSLRFLKDGLITELLRETSDFSTMTYLLTLRAQPFIFLSIQAVPRQRQISDQRFWIRVIQFLLRAYT